MSDTHERQGISLTSASDDEILNGLATLLRQSRRTESELVAHLGEVDTRRLYAREAFPSMFAYCTEALHLSEAEAYLRITVARASREHPVLLAMLADGRLHLSGIARLSPHLTSAKRDELLLLATHKSKQQIIELIADLAPRPDAPTLVRKLPQSPAVGLPASKLCPDAVQPLGSDPARPAGLGSWRAGIASVELRPGGVEGPLSTAATVEPLGGTRYKVQFTANAALRDKLERLRALLRGEVPDGDLAAVVERAVTETIERIERRRHAASDRPRRSLLDTDTAPSSRRIPSAVRRAVHQRDGNRCAFVSASAGAVESTLPSSTITGARSEWAEATIRATSHCSAGRTTAGWPSRTTDARRCGAPGAGSERPLNDRAGGS